MGLRALQHTPGRGCFVLCGFSLFSLPTSVAAYVGQQRPGGFRPGQCRNLIKKPWAFFQGSFTRVDTGCYKGSIRVP